MKKLKIAQIAPLWFSIPPRKYGGTERIIHFLTEELVKRGHEVTLFASGDSKTKAKLVSVTKKCLIDQNIPWHDYWWNAFNLAIALERAEEFDIIHTHWYIAGGNFQKLIQTPLLHTFHNIPRKNDHRWKTLKYYQDIMKVVFISKSEKKNCPLKFKNNWVVYNGIDLTQFKLNLKPKDHFVWIGRVDPAKGIENAILAAEKTGARLFLAGQVQPMREDYFKNQIKPRLTSKIQYLGEIPQEELSDFYGSAKALLYPIEWEEPFGLVMAESMACGTPVIVFDRGSAKEVVKDGETGFVVNGINELIKAMEKIDTISREKCRKWVEKKFSFQRMVSDYEKIYYQILKEK